MTLLSTITKSGGQILKTYQARNGNITYLLTNEIPGVSLGKRIVNCDSFGNPKKIIDLIPGKRKDVYIRAEDGSTILQKGKEIVNIAHVAFNSLCERFFQ